MLTYQSNQTVKDGKSFNRKKLDIIFSLLFIAAVGLTVWGIRFHQRTIIDARFLVMAVIAGTIAALLILLLVVRAPYSIVWTFLQSVAIGGGIFYFGLLCLNRAFAEKKVAYETCKIMETGTLGRSGKSRRIEPYAMINFKGSIKQLVFPYNLEKPIENYSTVSLSYSKGLFGFDVIRTQVLHQ